jgi:fibrillarin-like rRNA methylase
MKPQRQEYGKKKRDEDLKHLDTPTTAKACVQHIVENAKEKLHNRKQKQPGKYSEELRKTHQTSFTRYKIYMTYHSRLGAALLHKLSYS